MSKNVPTAAQSVIPLSFGKKSSPYELVEYSVAIREYHVYMSEAIDDPIEYVDLLTSLRRASEHDTFYFYLNTPGGRLDAGLQIINGMRGSAARIVTVLDPQAYSMGALLFLSGQELIVPENSMLMFHNYSSGTHGKGNEQLAEVQAASRSFEKVMKNICQPFLSADEIRNILNGQDLWLDSEDILKRLQRMQVDASTVHPSERGRKKSKNLSQAADVAEVVEAFTEVAVPPAESPKKPRKKAAQPVAAEPAKPVVRKASSKKELKFGLTPN